MRRATAIWLLGAMLLTQPLFGAWQEELTPGPGPFPALRPFRAHYKFGWALVSAAEANFDYSTDKNGPARLEMSARSTGPVRVTWRMDATHTATMDPVTLRPISVRQTEVYRSGKLSTKLDFTQTGVSRLRESEPPDGPPPKTKTFDFPNLLDLHSSLHFIRSQRMKPGDVYKMAVYPATSPYLAQVNVAGRQQLKVDGRFRPTLRLDLKLWQIEKDLALSPHQKFKRASVWISDDENRLPLRIETEIFVGKVWAELDRLEMK